jgi:predicted AAA+ superfamily ATPase
LKTYFASLNAQQYLEMIKEYDATFKLKIAAASEKFPALKFSD